MTNVVIEAQSEAAAESALTEAGFSLGRLQRGDRRGILHGDYEIMKWRNLRQSDIDALHGVYQRQSRDGPVTITMRDTAPENAVAELRAKLEADAAADSLLGGEGTP